MQKGGDAAAPNSLALLSQRRMKSFSVPNVRKRARQIELVGEASRSVFCRAALLRSQDFIHDGPQSEPEEKALMILFPQMTFSQ